MDVKFRIRFASLSPWHGALLHGALLHGALLHGALLHSALLHGEGALAVIV